MECNKDEALRAKQMAEIRMENNDFERARKIALKAQQLFPEVENIKQLLSVCHVHCSAQKTLPGLEKDWYGILQVESSTDDSTINEQYRQLAVYLHPDKNQFPGADAAFKLISEAYAVLSDPSSKLAYNLRVLLTDNSAPECPPPHHNTKSSESSMQFPPVSSDQFSRVSQHPVAPTNNTRVGIFCSICPYCSFKHQCDRKILNTTLRCQKCFKNFLGYEVGSEPKSCGTQVPVGLGVGQSADFQEKGGHKCQFSPDVQNMASSVNAPRGGRRIDKFFGDASGRKKRDLKNKSGKGCKRYVVESSDIYNFSECDVESVKTWQRVSGIQQERGTATKVSVDVNRGKKNMTDASSLNRRKGGETSNANVINRKSGALKANRSRKKLVESSESCDNSSHSSMDDIAMEGNIGDDASDIKLDCIPDHFTRRSSRKRQHVSYSESDVQSPTIPLKRTCSTTGKDEKQQKDDVDEDPKHEKPNACSKQETKGKKPTDFGKKIPENYAYCKIKGIMGAENCSKASDCGTVDIEGESVIKPLTRKGTEADLFCCPDPEFNDFDMLREENSFCENQFWACYDSFDGMPRLYAKVKKVRAFPFELSITWLEAVLVNEGYKEWVDEALPVGCGSFRLGNTEKTSVRLTFSHLVHCETEKKRGSYIIYPRKGEVWALFKDWDISWSSNPENYKELKYEFVEVLSDFVLAEGFKVAYLEKVRGFLSLFKRASENVSDSFYVCPEELYKFSHSVPYFKLNGSEREGVPVGSFELDPASLSLGLPM